MPDKYSAAIIGCGNMGAFYSKPGGNAGIMTHAHAYKSHSRIKLAAFLDIDKKRAEKAARLWGGNAYSDIGRMFKKEDIDIVSICVPDELHKDILEACLDYRLKAVFCEKPLTTDVNSARNIIRKYSKRGILVAVNFFRRFDALVIDLKKAIEEKRYGNVLNAIGIYTKGVLHNGSHLIDISRYLFGEVESMEVFSARTDWRKTDPTIDAFLKFSKGVSMHIVAADERRYSIFEIDVLFEKSRVSFLDFGKKVDFYKTKDISGLPNYKELKKVYSKRTQINKAIFKAIANLIDAIEGKEKLLCPGSEALAAQRICQDLMCLYSKRRK